MNNKAVYYSFPPLDDFHILYLYARYCDVNLGFYYALSAIFWLTALIYWLANLKHQLHSLQAFVLPPAAVFVLLPAFEIKNHYIPQIEAASSLFVVHIAIAILAYSLFTFAALHALLMAIAERSLHNKPTFIKL